MDNTAVALAASRSGGSSTVSIAAPAIISVPAARMLWMTFGAVQSPVARIISTVAPASDVPD